MAVHYGDPVVILLVEDSPSDVRLVQEALRESKIRNVFHVVEDGEDAVAFLHGEGEYEGSPRPDLILLDLNLPGMDGREVLTYVKSHEELRDIPVVVITTSEAHEDIQQTYRSYANCYITKPVDLDQFVKVIRSIEDFWLTIVKLPKATS